MAETTVPDPKRSRNLWRENGCTPACAETVPCPVCRNALPPCGRSVAPEVCLPDCCETHRYDLANTRHLWSADELDDLFVTARVCEVVIGLGWRPGGAS